MLFWTRYTNPSTRKKNRLTDVCYAGIVFLGLLLYSICTGAELSFRFVFFIAAALILTFCLYDSVAFAVIIGKHFSKLPHCTERVSGICIDLEKHAHQAAYRPVWAYRYQGVSYKVPDAFNRFTNAVPVKSGDTQELWLNPEFPDKPYSVNRRADRIMIGMLVFYIAAELAGLVLLFLYI